MIIGTLLQILYKRSFSFDLFDFTGVNYNLTGMLNVRIEHSDFHNTGFVVGCFHIIIMPFIHFLLYT